jgi:amphi-Trp domain-containing protein
MADKQSFDFSATIEAGDVASYLESIARGLRDANLVLQSGDQAIALAVGRELSFDVDASAGKNKASVQIELSWKLPGPTSERGPLALTISSGTSVGQSEDPNSF